MPQVHVFHEIERFFDVGDVFVAKLVTLYLFRIGKALDVAQ